jgi:hypothetical protein
MKRKSRQAKKVQCLESVEVDARGKNVEDTPNSGVLSEEQE